MALSGDEQRLLDGIEAGLRAADPAFAAKLTLEAAASYRRRQVGLVHGCLWWGMFMTLAGFALVHEVLAAGVLVILYGTGTLIVALSAVWQLRQWDAAPRSVTGRRGRDC